MFMCSESELNPRSANDTRGRVFAFYQITVYLFFGLTQFLLSWLDETGFVLFSVLMSLAIELVLVTRVPTHGLRLERVRGIEPPFKAWEAFVLPLNYTRFLTI